jgi:hypothetical protein
MSRGGRRAGAGRRAALPPIAHLLIGARAATLLAYREILHTNAAIPYRHLEIARDQLDAVPIEKRNGYPSPVLKWVRTTLDNAGRCIEGRTPNFTETVSRVAREASREYGVPVSPRKVRECLKTYQATFSRAPESPHQGGPFSSDA